MEIPHNRLLDAMPCYLTVQDKDLRILEANRRFREDFGERVGSHCYKAYKHRDQPCAPCPVQQTFHDGQEHHSEEVVVSRSGEAMNVLVNTAPLHDADGHIAGVLEMSTNITEIRQLESQLADVGLLVGQIAHSIKGLLTGLDGGRYLINTGLEQKNQNRIEHGWEMVKRNTDQIRNLVLNILFHARDHEPRYETISVPRLAREVADLVAGKAAENHIEIIREIEPEAGEFEADAQAIHSLLVNLLENSLEACWLAEDKKEHHVWVRARGLDEAVEFEVEDDGPGMDQETREKAFTLFFTSKGSKGTGLGLFISNKIAQAHGGSVSLESEVDKGARFLVRIPRRRQEGPAAQGASPASENQASKGESQNPRQRTP